MSTRDALLLIDLQEGFFDTPELSAQRADVVAVANALTAAARAAQIPIFLVSTEHSRDRSTWTLSMLDDGQGYLFHGDPTAEVLPELDTDGVTRIEKTRDSAWFGTDLLLRVRNLGVQRVVIVGVSTHACIAATARDAFANNVRCTIVPEGIGDERPDHRRSVLDLLVDDRQAVLESPGEVIERWRRQGVS